MQKNKTFQLLATIQCLVALTVFMLHINWVIFIYKQRKKESYQVHLVN